MSFTLIVGASQAAALTGSGPHLVIPTPNLGAPLNQTQAITNLPGGFTGSWTSPALAPWLGSFTATGPVPGGFTSTGITQYDFSGLPGGVLHTGTFFIFSDVDFGSGIDEQFELQAFDAGGAITTPWLDVAIGVSGTGHFSNGAIGFEDLPGWDFDAVTGVYTIDGVTTAPFNPNLTVFLPSNMDITGLTVNRFSTFEGFTLGAPIPTPGSAVVLGLGGLAFIRRRR